jgi:hypothetical protein
MVRVGGAPGKREASGTRGRRRGQHGRAPRAAQATAARGRARTPRWCEGARVAGAVPSQENNPAAGGGQRNVRVGFTTLNDLAPRRRAPGFWRDGASALAQREGDN